MATPSILVRDAQPGVRYRPLRRPAIGRTRYVLAPAGTALRLVKRLVRLVQLRTIRTDQQEELRDARAALAGTARLFVRTTQGPGWSMKRYIALPLDYRIRPERARSRDSATEGDSTT